MKTSTTIEEANNLAGNLSQDNSWGEATLLLVVIFLGYLSVLWFKYKFKSNNNIKNNLDIKHNDNTKLLQEELDELGDYFKEIELQLKTMDSYRKSLSVTLHQHIQDEKAVHSDISREVRDAKQHLNEKMNSMSSHFSNMITRLDSIVLQLMQVNKK